MQRLVPSKNIVVHERLLYFARDKRLYHCLEILWVFVETEEVEFMTEELGIMFVLLFEREFWPVQKKFEFFNHC